MSLQPGPHAVKGEACVKMKQVNAPARKCVCAQGDEQ